MKRLTALNIARLGIGMHHDAGAPGLYLQVTSKGARSWIWRFTLNGKTRDLGLGSAKAIPLKRARELAAEARRLRAEGVDPLERRREQRSTALVAASKAMTFQQCAEAYVAAHESGWRSSKHHQQWAATLAYLNPLIGPLPVRAIDVALVLKCVSPIWTEKPVTAGRTRARLESILDYAKARAFRDGENPARWKGGLDHLLPKLGRLVKVEHFAALDHRELPSLMADLRSQTNTSARCLEFTILTAARTSEVIGARWDEIDLQAKLWTVPQTRTKSGRPHRVPLSSRPLAILGEMRARREGQFIFSGTRSGVPLGNRACWLYCAN